MVYIESGNAVKFAGILFRRRKAFPLYGQNVNEQRRALLLPVCIKQHGKFFDVVPVNRADVLEPHFLKHCGMIQRTPKCRFHRLDACLDGAAHDRRGVQERFYIPFCFEITRAGAQLGKILRHRTDVFGNGHFVVVEHDDQIVQATDIVHALIDHATGKSAVSHDGNDLARLMPKLLRLGHADGSGE